MVKNFELNMRIFCDDALEVLEKYDHNIREKIINGSYSNFYSFDWKGIGIASTTEPTIKYLIYTNLLDKYRMWSELKDYYNNGKENGKLLDLGLYFGKESDLGDEEIIPNIAIEMKWTKLTNAGFFYKNWLQSIKRDTAKLCRCNPEYKQAEKYFMQFLFVKNNKQSNYIKVKLQKQLTEQINSIVDHRTLRSRTVKLVYNKGFESCGVLSSADYVFMILLWKID